MFSNPGLFKEVYNYLSCVSLYVLAAVTKGPDEQHEFIYRNTVLFPVT